MLRSEKNLCLIYEKYHIKSVFENLENMITWFFPNIKICTGRISIINRNQNM